MSAARNEDAEHRVARRAEELFVLLAWAWCAVVLVRYVARYASRLPFTDDVLMAQYVDPAKELTAQLLWVQHNEHRIPLPKLLYVWTVGGLHDLRAGVWLEVVLLLALSAALLAALRKRTGTWRASDAVVPLLLLGTGNTENLLNSFQVTLALPAFFTGALLVLAVRAAEPDARAGWRTIATFWVVLLLLAACGTAGLVQTAAFALWPLALGWRAWRARHA